MYRLVIIIIAVARAIAFQMLENLNFTENSQLVVFQHKPNYQYEKFICEVPQLSNFTKYWVNDHNVTLKGDLEDIMEDSGMYICFIEFEHGVFISSNYHVITSSTQFYHLSFPEVIESACDTNSRMYNIDITMHANKTFYWEIHPPPQITIKNLRAEDEKRIVVGNAFELIIVYPKEEDNDRTIQLELSIAFDKKAKMNSIIQQNDNCSEAKHFGPIWASTPMEDKNVTCVLGQPLLVKCIAYGNPIPTINFTAAKNMHLADYMNKEENGILFKSCSFGHTSKFKCFAKNNMGNISKEFFLEVTGPPVIRQCSKGGTFSEGSYATFSCNFQSPYSQELILLRNGIEFNVDNMDTWILRTVDTINVTFAKLWYDDSAIYQFVAKNKFGNRVYNFNVNVLGKLKMVSKGLKILLHFNMAKIDLDETALINVRVTNNNSSALKENVPIANFYILVETDPMSNYTVAVDINFKNGLKKSLMGSILSGNQEIQLGSPIIPHVSYVNSTLFKVKFQKVVGALFYKISYKIQGTSETIAAGVIFAFETLNLDIKSKSNVVYEVWYDACDGSICKTSPITKFEMFDLNENPNEISWLVKICAIVFSIITIVILIAITVCYLRILLKSETIINSTENDQKETDS